MKKLRIRVKNLIYQFKEISLDEVENWDKKAFHLDYDNNKYRQNEVASIVKDAMPHFALTEEELNDFISTKDLGEANREAWSRISTARKDKKGDYGELLLYLILEIFYPAKKFVTKVRLRSSRKEQVKGFDCAHFTIEDEQVYLWLGEAKFHQSFSTGLIDSISSIIDHCQPNYLKDEMSILKTNIEINKEFKDYEKLEEIFLGKSLDKIKFKIPILLTYDSQNISKFTDINDDFNEIFEKEFRRKFKAIENKTILLESQFELIFFIIPFESVKSIKNRLEIIEGIFND
jgi:hypothetical protein